MRQIVPILLLAALMLLPHPAAAQACNAQALRGVWCFTCNGFTELSNLNPAAPKGTLVPLSMIGRARVDSEGVGTATGTASIAGTIMAFDMKDIFKVNSDCSGEKTHTMQIKNGPAMTGKGTIVFMPHGQEFRVLLLVPGDVVTCEYKKMLNTLLAF